MSAPLRVVLVGAGTRAHNLYLPWMDGRLPFHGGPVRPLAVVDDDRSAARNAAGALREAAVVAPGDLFRFLCDTRPDLVVVATPDHAHTQPAAQALAAGCPVLVEKPLATTTADAFALVRAAEASSAPLLVGHNLRFTNVHRHVQRLLADGRIGDVVGADFHYTLNPSHARSYFTRWHRTRAASGGLEVTKASHHLDLLSWWLRSRPTAVTAMLDRCHYRPGVDGVPADADIHDSVHALVQYACGATAHYALTSNAPREGYTCTLRGTRGSCTVRYTTGEGPHRVDVHTVSGTGGGRELILREEGTHAGADLRMLRALPAALGPAAAPEFATAADAASAVATGAALFASSTQGRRLPVPDPDHREALDARDDRTHTERSGSVLPSALPR